MRIDNEQSIGRFRSSIRRWQAAEHAVSTQHIVSGVLHQGSRLPFKDKIGVRLGIETRIATGRGDPFSPAWMSKGGVIKMVSELSAPRIWGQLLEDTPDEVKGMLGDNISETSTSITHQNAGFLITGIYASLMAVAEGPNTQDIVKAQRLLPVVSAIGERYPVPPKTPQEFIERVKELVPNPDKPRASAEPTLFDYLKTYNAFIKYEEGEQFVCPAIPLTQLLLDQWGRQLDTDPQYAERFRKTITRPLRGRAIELWNAIKNVN